jgi:antitoxin component of MazEF toxin-antitoxin module
VIERPAHHVKIAPCPKTTTTIDQEASLSLPPEVLEALGVEAGAELDVEIVGRAVVVRSVEEATRSREFINTFESILDKRRGAYDELAKGPSQ